MDRILPQNTLAVFPVQYFSRHDLPRAERLRASRTQSEIFFGNTFGGNRHSLGGGTPHRAIDIMAPRGVPVFATTPGTVPATWRVYQEVRPDVRRAVEIPAIGTPENPPNGDGGNYVVLVDNDGRHHYYAHLNARTLVSIGQSVRAGQLLGYVGNSGRRAQFTPTHLHYQVTTRPTATLRRPLTFWNPYDNLVRLAAEIGGGGRGRVRISYDSFLRAVQSRLAPGLIDPWSGRVSPEILHPWHEAF